MNKVRLHDKEFSTYLSKEIIQEATKEVARKIQKDMKGKRPLFLIVLNGAFVFAADLLRQMDLDCELTFVKLSSYVGTKSTNTVRELIGLDQTVKDRTVVIIEDIIDSGLTMEHTIHKLKDLEASEVKIATLLFKPGAFKRDYKIDYIGLKIPNDFIVGYGLDYDGLGRNLPDIYKVVPD